MISEFIQLRKEFGISFFFRIIGLIIGYAYYFLIAKIYGAKGVGLFALSMMFLNIGSILGKVGLDTAIIRFISELVEQKQYLSIWHTYLKVLKILFFISLIISCASYLLSKLIADIVFHNNDLFAPFRIISLIIFPYIVLFINSECFRAMYQITKYLFFQSVAPLLLSIIFLVISTNLISLNFLPVVCYSLSVLFLSIVSSFFLFQSLRLNKKYSISCEYMAPTTKKILKISLPMFFTTSSLMLMNWIDTVMIGFFLSVRDVGIYNICIKMINLINILVTSIHTTTLPRFSAFLAHHSILKLKKTVKAATGLFLIFGGPVFFSLVCFPKMFLSFWGRDFLIGVSPLVILSIGQFVHGFCSSAGYLLNMTGYQRQVFLVVASAALINILLNVYLIPNYGMNGAAIATTVSKIIWSMCLVIFVKYVYKFWIIEWN